MRVLIQVHSESYILEDSATIDRVRMDILAAVRDGGAFVRMGQTEWATEVLVTPASPVRISRIPDREAAEDDPFGDFSPDGDLSVMSWDDV